MAFPTVYISLHSINVMSAHAPGGLGNPVIITVKGFGGDTQLALHVSTKEYAERLASAINGAVGNNGVKVAT